MRFYLYSRNKKTLFGWEADADWRREFFDDIRKHCAVRYDFGDGGFALLCDRRTIAFFEAEIKRQKEASNPRALTFSAFFNDKNIGQIIFLFDSGRISDWVRFGAIQYLESGVPDNELSSYFDSLTEQYKILSAQYDYRAYGFDDIKYYAGEPDKNKRVCRFCNATGLENFVEDEAHAIPDSLGNKLLFCNEECKVCNHTLNRLEDDLISLMRVRQAMFRIKRKKKSSAPQINGQDFVIRPDEKGNPHLYLMEEKVPANWRQIRKIPVRLNLKYETVDQDIYRAFAKIVIDLAPSEYLPQFRETISWIKSGGKFMADSLPSIQYAILNNGIFYEQPVVELYFYRKDDAEVPFCLCYLRIYDMVYRFIVPFAAPDKGNFRKDSELYGFWSKLKSNIPLKWESQSLIDWWESAPWCEMDVDTDNPHIHILPSTDPIFEHCKAAPEPAYVEYPEFDAAGVKVVGTHRIVFKDHAKRHIVTEQEKKDFTLTYTPPVLRILLQAGMIRLFFKMDAGTHDNPKKYFSMELCMDVSSPDFYEQVDFNDKTIGVNREFSVAVIDRAFEEAVRQLMNKLRYSQFRDYPLQKNIVGNEQFYSQIIYEVYGQDGIYRFPHDFFHGGLPEEKRFFYLAPYDGSPYKTIYPHRR